MTISDLTEKFSNRGHNFKLYTLLSILFVVIQLECNLFVTKQISIIGINLTMSGITYPVNLLILGVITNCYGYQYARQLLWLNNFMVVQFICYSLIAHSIPPSHAMIKTQFELVSSYDRLIPIYIRNSISGMIGENIANFIFIWLVNKSKIVQNGKKIGWRIIKYSIIANLIMLSASYSIIFWDYTFTHLVTLILNVMLIKIIIELIFIKLVVVCANKLRALEGMEVFDNTTYNPFSLLINYDYLNIVPTVDAKYENNPN